MKPISRYDPEVIEVLNGVVANMPDKKMMLLEILYRKDYKQYSFVVHNPYYGTACEADWMAQKDLLPALKEMQAAFETLIKELEDGDIT